MGFSGSCSTFFGSYFCCSFSLFMSNFFSSSSVNFGVIAWMGETGWPATSSYNFALPVSSSSEAIDKQGNCLPSSMNSIPQIFNNTRKLWLIDESNRRYYLAKKYLHTLGQSSFIDQIVLMTQIQITQYFIWFPWAAITATIRRGILS